MIAWLLGVALAAPLTLDTVLGSVGPRIPEIEAAWAKEEQARGKFLASQGAFDPKVKGKASRYLDGYDRTLAEAGIGAATLYGPEIGAGWRLGEGEFPSYDGRKTGAGGEWYARVEVPVLDGLVMPASRAERMAAGAYAGAMTAAREDKERLIRWKASQAWAKWAASGAKLAIQEDYVAQTEARQQALDREVEEGVRAPLEQLDNLRALEHRRADLEVAEQALVEAAQALSLYWRDADGRPLVPGRDELPEVAATLPTLEGEPRALAESRTDARALDAMVEAADVRLRRARLARLPDLALEAEGVRPLDDALPSELIAGVQLEMATLLRKERGYAAAAAADLRQMEAEHRATVDRAVAEIEATRSAVVRARARLASAEAAAEAAAQVVDLERRRFALGGGDIFTLLGREAQRVASDKDVVDARLALVLAEVHRAAAEHAAP